MPVYEQRIVSMTTEQWSALEGLAVQTDSIAKRGPGAGNPSGAASWRRLLERIAAGELVVITPLHKAKLAKAPEPA